MNIKAVSGTVSSIGAIVIAFIAVETRYIDAEELKNDPRISKMERFIPKWEQQRIWDMEENVEKSSSPDERKRWMRRLRSLIADYCHDYKDLNPTECQPGYLDYLKDDNDE